jgi:hypothetical protein
MYYSFILFAEKHPAFSVTRLRNIYFNREKNGSHFAFKKVRRNIVVSESKFLKWIDLQNEHVFRGKILEKDLDSLEFSEIENKVLIDKDHLIEWMESLISSKVTAYLVTK